LNYLILSILKVIKKRREWLDVSHINKLMINIYIFKVFTWLYYFACLIKKNTKMVLHHEMCHLHCHKNDIDWKYDLLKMTNIVVK